MACYINLTPRDILYRMPWQTVVMMMLDRGRTVRKKTNQTKELETEEEADAFLSNTKGYRRK